MKLNVTILEGQSLLDLALQLYGDVSMVYKLIADNSNLENVNQTTLTGLVINYEVQGNKITEYFVKEDLFISTKYPFDIEGQYLLQENLNYLLQENECKIKI
ncbi:MAG: hypothetical protein ABI241_00480 [Bacteroidia bacterium]